MATTAESKTIFDLLLVELRSALKQRGLDPFGLKAVLVERLQHALISEGKDPRKYIFTSGVVGNSSEMENSTEQTKIKCLSNEDNNLNQINSDSSVLTIDASISETNLDEGQDEENPSSIDESNDDQVQRKTDTITNDSGVLVIDELMSQSFVEEAEEESMKIETKPISNVNNIKEINDTKSSLNTLPVVDDSNMKANTKQTQDNKNELLHPKKSDVEDPEKVVSSDGEITDTSKKTKTIHMDSKEAQIENKAKNENFNPHDKVKSQEKGEISDKKVKNQETANIEEKNEKNINKRIDFPKNIETKCKGDKTGVPTNVKIEDTSHQMKKIDTVSLSSSSVKVICNLEVTNIMKNTKAIELQKLFVQYGRVLEVKIIHNNSKTLCMAIVKMELIDADNIIKQLNVLEFKGKLLKVTRNTAMKIPNNLNTKQKTDSSKNTAKEIDESQEQTDSSKSTAKEIVESQDKTDSSKSTAKEIAENQKKTNSSKSTAKEIAASQVKTDSSKSTAKEIAESQEKTDSSNSTAKEISESQEKTEVREIDRNLWVTNLMQSTKAQDIKQMLSKYGKVIGVKVVKNSSQPTKSCYGYVTMESKAAVDNCIKMLDKTKYNDRIIRISATKKAPVLDVNPDKNNEKSATKKGKESTEDSNIKKEDSTKKYDEKNDSIKKDNGATKDNDVNKDEDVKSDGGAKRDDGAKKDDGTKKDDIEKKNDGAKKEENAKQEESAKKDIVKKIYNVKNDDDMKMDNKNAKYENPKRGVISYKMCIARERELQRESERHKREEERRLRRELERSREISRRQRDEVKLLEREREKLRKERAIFERERAEIIRVERQREKIERERIEQEKQELKRQQQRIEEVRRAEKRSISMSDIPNKRLATDLQYNEVPSLKVELHKQKGLSKGYIPQDCPTSYIKHPEYFPKPLSHIADYQKPSNYSKRIEEHPKRTVEIPNHPVDYPKRLSDYPKRLSDYPKSSSDYPKSSSDYLKHVDIDNFAIAKRSDEYSKRSDEYPKRSDEYSKRSDEYPKRCDEHLKRSDDYSKRPDNYPKRSDDYPKQTTAYPNRSDDYPKRSDDYPKRSADYSKRSDDYSKCAIDYSIESGDYNKRSNDYLSRPIDHHKRSDDYYSKHTDDYTKRTSNFDVNYKRDFLLTNVQPSGHSSLQLPSLLETPTLYKYDPPSYHQDRFKHILEPTRKEIVSAPRDSKNSEYVDRVKTNNASHRSTQKVERNHDRKPDYNFKAETRPTVNTEMSHYRNESWKLNLSPAKNYRTSGDNSSAPPKDFWHKTLEKAFKEPIPTNPRQSYSYDNPGPSCPPPPGINNYSTNSHFGSYPRKY